MAARRWLSKRKATAILTELAEMMAITSLHLVLFDANGRLLAATPDDSMVDHCVPPSLKVLQTQEEAVTTESAAFPLAAHGELIGALAARTDDGWPEGTLAVLRAARATLIRLAEAEIEKRALAQETLDRYREINLLYRIGENIGATVDLDEVTDLILQESMTSIKVSKGLVMLTDQAAGDLVVKAQRGAAMPEGERWPLTQGVLGEVARDGKPHIVNDTTSDPRTECEANTFTSVLCVPLKTRDKLLGILALGNKTPESSGPTDASVSAMFTASDQSLLMALASQAAVAIDTALEVQAREERLRQQIRDLRIEIDHVKKAKQVAEITETDYFQRLRAEARRLRTQPKKALR